MKRFWFIIPMLLLVVPVLAQEPPQEKEQEPAPVVTRISGTLLGADGEPMDLAHVHIHPLTSSKVVAGMEVAPDGRYELETDTTGVFRLRFTGVHHLEKSGTLLLTGTGNPLEIDAQLSTHTYKEDFSEVKVIGDFNDFSFSKDTRAM